MLYVILGREDALKVVNGVRKLTEVQLWTPLCSPAAEAELGYRSSSLRSPAKEGSSISYEAASDRSQEHL